MSDYVSLHNHTTYSFMGSLIRPSKLFDKAKELGQSAIAVTDHSTLAGAWDCLKASKKTGVKLIMGCEFNFVDDIDKEGKIRHIILLAKNHQGYKNLLMTSKLANDNHVVFSNKAIPRIDWKILEEYSEGLICTTACSGGILGQLINTKRINVAKEQVQRLKTIYGDCLALEIQPHAMKRNASPFNDYDDQMLVNNTLIDFGKEFDIKVIATTNAHYVTPDQWEAHDTLLSIGAKEPVKSRGRLKYTVNDFYIKGRDQVMKFLTRCYLDKAEEYCDNTLYFAKMCEDPAWIDPKFSNKSGIELPKFPVKDMPDHYEFLKWFNVEVLKGGVVNPNMAEDAAYLRYWCDKEFHKVPAGKEVEYRAQIEKEFDVFEYKDLSSYMLIVADYVNWSKNNQIPVGPGRGSVAGSLVAYLLGIHDADPIKYGLIFERFYNKLKVGMSDIDVDFSKKGKPKVEKYIISKYGEEYCAKISNYSTLTPKVYARHIAKAFQFGGSRKSAIEIGNAISDSIPKELTTVSTIVDHAPLFAEYAKKYPELKKFSKDLGNIDLNYSIHAGAVVIGKRPLVEIVPLRKTKDNQIVIEYEKDRTEENGLVKMDILGLSTLDIIDATFKLIKDRGKEPPSLPWDYDKNDSKTYELIGSGKTYGVFQLGKSGGTIQLCIDMKPKNIEDLAMINSMARPGFPKEIRGDFIKSKKDNIVNNVIHSSLKRSLEPTFGFALFDEVLLNLAKDVAGWDLAEADRLRKFVKSKGKNKDKDKILRDDFILGAINNGIEPKMANDIWDKVLSNFGAYIFNKAHAVTYSFIGYQTAFLKAHFPVEFLICNLIHEDNAGAQTSENNKTIIKKEIRLLGVNIKPPSVNESANNYTILDKDTILTGFNSLKFMGADAVPEILKHRPFDSLEDMLIKVDGRLLRAPGVQAMAGSGSLDNFGMSRKQMYLYASDYKTKLQVWNKKKPGEPFLYPWPNDVGEWSLPERYAMEMYYVGEGLICGMREAYPGFFSNRAIKFSELSDMFPEPSGNEKFFIPSSKGTVEGVIKTYYEFKVKKETSKIFGQTMAKIDIEDPYGGTTSMTLFPSGLDTFNERLRRLAGNKIIFEPGIAIHCAASINWYEGEVSLIFENLINVSPIPPRPKDLKKRTVSMKIVAKKKVRKKVSKIDRNMFTDQVEDELIEEGHSEL